MAEYLIVRSAAAERARRTKGKVELSDAERKQMRSISVFCLWLPPGFAAFAWLIWS